MSNSEFLLQLRNICKSFSGVKVLDDVNLDLKRGEVLGLVGENGAGKSTLMNILGGVLKSDSGSMLLDEKEYKPNGSMDALQKGIAFVHQELNMFNNLTVAENMFINDFPKTKYGAIDYKEMLAKTKETLLQLDDEIKADAIVEDLPMGQRQLAEIGKAIEKKSRIIIFDEPTTSLSNKEKEKLFGVIESLVKKGVSIIYISHILEDVFRLCDTVIVLRDGQVMGRKSRQEIVKDEIIKLMVGRSLNQLFPYYKKNRGKEIFSVKDLNQGKKLKNISFSLHEAEIVGLFGLMGAGRSELARAIFGVDEFESGEIRIYGENITGFTPKNLISKGVAFITENRREEGLLMPKSVRDNLSLAYLNKIKGLFSYVRVKEENRDTDKEINDLKIKTFNKLLQEARMLSGGNQQKVVIGKWMLKEPRIFIMDEPTRGIDVGAKYEIYNHMNTLAEKNTTILFISSEMEELMGVCDRILVMCRGQIIGDLERESFSQDVLIKLAFGGEC